jgi:hypothetical protein
MLKARAEPGEAEVTIYFHRKLAEYSADDRRAIIRKLRSFMRDPKAFREKIEKERRKKLEAK